MKEIKEYVVMDVQNYKYVNNQGELNIIHIPLLDGLNERIHDRLVSLFYAGGIVLQAVGTGVITNKLNYYDSNIAEATIERWDGLFNFDESDEWVKCAATVFSFDDTSAHSQTIAEDVIIPSIRHYDSHMVKLLRCLMEDGQMTKTEISQGFVTNKLRYVDRPEAKHIAKSHSQLVRSTIEDRIEDFHTSYLLSEHLY